MATLIPLFRPLFTATLAGLALILGAPSTPAFAASEVESAILGALQHEATLLDPLIRHQRNQETTLTCVPAGPQVFECVAPSQLWKIVDGNAHEQWWKSANARTRETRGVFIATATLGTIVANLALIPELHDLRPVFVISAAYGYGAISVLGMVLLTGTGQHHLRDSRNLGTAIWGMFKDVAPLAPFTAVHTSAAFGAIFLPQYVLNYLGIPVPWASGVGSFLVALPLACLSTSIMDKLHSVIGGTAWRKLIPTLWDSRAGRWLQQSRFGKKLKLDANAAHLSANFSEEFWRNLERAGFSIPAIARREWMYAVDRHFRGKAELPLSAEWLGPERFARALADYRIAIDEALESLGGVRLAQTLDDKEASKELRLGRDRLKWNLDRLKADLQELAKDRSALYRGDSFAWISLLRRLATLKGYATEWREDLPPQLVRITEIADILDRLDESLAADLPAGFYANHDAAEGSPETVRENLLARIRSALDLGAGVGPTIERISLPEADFSSNASRFFQEVTVSLRNGDQRIEQPVFLPLSARELQAIEDEEVCSRVLTGT